MFAVDKGSDKRCVSQEMSDESLVQRTSGQLFRSKERSGSVIIVLNIFNSIKIKNPQEIQVSE
jgi:hypothetical protein